MKLSVLLLRPGMVHVVKGPWDEFQCQVDAVTALRDAHPDAVIVPLAVRDDGQVWAELESEFMALSTQGEKTECGESRSHRQARVIAAIQGETEIGYFLIQKRLRCSYNEAVSILEDLEQRRLIAPADDHGKHAVIMS
jgi:hypothetical protein